MKSTDDIAHKRAELERRRTTERSCRDVALHKLAKALHCRFQIEHKIDDLNEAITLHRAALALRPLGNKNRSVSLGELAICLRNKYDNQGVVADLEEAVTLGRAVLELRPPGHPDRDVSLHNLARDLRTRFEKQADIHDLEKAIELHRAALELHPYRHPCRSSSLENLAVCLADRYDHQGVVADLEEAVILGRAALELRPPGHPDRDTSLGNLACYLSMRFEKHAHTHNLEEAIELYRATLVLRPPGHPRRSSSLQKLSLCLANRYDNQGAVADLEEAVTLGRAALELRPPGHIDRDASLDTLACHLSMMFKKRANMRDLEQAIELYRAVLELRPPGHPYRFSSLQNLALCLSDRYDKQAAVADFKEAAVPGRAARMLRPSAHPNRGTADLDEAIALEQEALQLLTPGDRQYDKSRRRLTARLQMKIRSQVAPLSSNASPVPHFDVKQVIRNVASETLKTMPTRMLDTRTGILCDRDAQLSHFMSSEQYDQLLSSCATYDPAHQMKLIRSKVSRYFWFVTLSHRWGEGEPSLHDVEGHSIYGMPAKGGLEKLHAFCALACEKHYLWAWSDTCCIDKGSSAELQEAIGSMFAWYRRSNLTIVYLSDVSDTNSFRSSEWFGRGWTLQELLAPKRLLFYTQTWSLYRNLTSSNHKSDAAVLEELERATGIESRLLTNFSPGMDDARSRLQWASLRRTTRPEDIAYSLFGIFNIHLPVLYGESAENALGRLLAEIISQSGDISVLDWVGKASRFHSCFPARITSYQTLPLPLPLPNPEEHTSITSEQPAASLVLQTLHHSLAKSPLPRFLNRRLTLPCITYLVTTVQRRRENPSARRYTYKIQASGLRPLEIILPSMLENETMSQDALQLVRPWHSKLLVASTELKYATTEEQLRFALGRPFNALLFTELRHNEYRRIASSTPITAQPVDSVSILQSEIRTLDIV